MDTVAPHPHEFDENDWPFDVPVNAAAFSSEKIVHEHQAVLVVYHDHDGEWQFLHGDITDEDKCVLICMGCAYQRTPAIAELASMPSGWLASRKSASSSWNWEAYEKSDDEI